MTVSAFDSGSWRDRDGRVFTHNGRIYRALSERGRDDWTRFRRSRTFERAASRGAVVATTELPDGEVPTPPGNWAGVLSHGTIPFVSYPFEWTFGMLRDAAILQLDLLLDALDEGMVLKDGTAFNVQWIGSRPTFIDISSFTVLSPGAPWAGYRQFCAQCLNPLLLQAYKGVPFGPWLRGSLEGIEPGTLAALFSVRDLARPGVFTHVYLHAKMQQRYGDSQTNIRNSLKEAGLGAPVIRSTVRSLRRLVDRLSVPMEPTPWADYATNNSYEAEDHARKRAFVERVVGERRRGLIWDIGANTGEYSRIAASNSGYVLAFDADQGAVERHYQTIRRDGLPNILPLVINVLDSTPDMGWRLAERKSLIERGRPDLVLCLALAHHLVLGGNVPVPDLLSYLADLGDEAVIEFVDRADPMVGRLLRHRDDLFADYTRERFEAELSRVFRIDRREALTGDRRVLYYVTRGSDVAARSVR